jgi:hypothetical protein
MQQTFADGVKIACFLYRMLGRMLGMGTKSSRSLSKLSCTSAKKVAFHNLIQDTCALMLLFLHRMR